MSGWRGEINAFADYKTEAGEKETSRPQLCLYMDELLLPSLHLAIAYSRCLQKCKGLYQFRVSPSTSSGRIWLSDLKCLV